MDRVTFTAIAVISLMTGVIAPLVAQEPPGNEPTGDFPNSDFPSGEFPPGDFPQDMEPFPTDDQNFDEGFEQPNFDEDFESPGFEEEFESPGFFSLEEEIRFEDIDFKDVADGEERNYADPVQDQIDAEYIFRRAPYGERTTLITDLIYGAGGSIAFSNGALEGTPMSDQSSILTSGPLNRANSVEELPAALGGNRNLWK